MRETSVVVPRVVGRWSLVLGGGVLVWVPGLDCW